MAAVRCWGRQRAARLDGAGCRRVRPSPNGRAAFGWRRRAGSARPSSSPAQALQRGGDKAATSALGGGGEGRRCRGLRAGLASALRPAPPRQRPCAAGKMEAGEGQGREGGAARGQAGGAGGGGGTDATRRPPPAGWAGSIPGVLRRLSASFQGVFYE